MDKNDLSQQESPKNATKASGNTKMIIDSADQISRKFDCMLRTELRVLDQLISSDLYPMIEKEK